MFQDSGVLFFWGNWILAGGVCLTETVTAFGNSGRAEHMKIENNLCTHTFDFFYVVINSTTRNKFSNQLPVSRTGKVLLIIFREKIVWYYLGKIANSEIPKTNQHVTG